MESILLCVAFLALARVQSMEARQKLCMRGTTDYWVNAMDGAPFFAVSQSADPGLLQTLENEILPRLLKDVPNQPTEEELAADPLRERFTLIFDRAGYSPAAFKRLWEKRVAVTTYHKNPGQPWPETEFNLQKVTLVSGEEAEFSLAERGVQLLPEFWVREIRQHEPGGHQVAIVSTDFRRDLTKIAAGMFARWCQENFFQYMKKHFIDTIRLMAYRAETSLTCIVREKLTREDDARSLVRQILRSAADFSPTNRLKRSPFACTP